MIEHYLWCRLDSWEVKYHVSLTVPDLEEQLNEYLP